MTLPFSIIAATNFSETANNAVTYAAGFAKATGAKLTLFNAFSLSIHSANSRISAQGMQNELNMATARLELLAKNLSELFDIEVDYFCSYTFLEDQISTLITNINAELVVMGMAERSFEQDLLGNSTTSVIKNLNISVLAVPKNVRFSQSKKILFAIDSLRLFSVKRFSRFLEIAKKIQSEVEFFSVGKKVEDLIEQQSQLGVEETEALEHVKFLYKSIQSNSVINEIKKEAKNYNADILVMVPQKYGFWDSLVHVSKTRIMATGLHIPLLILRGY